jgi:alkylation response protein AidB-like acyl-CoA dehydrogenase
MCIGMSEPDAGSDLASLQTQRGARRRRLCHQRQKIWTSFAAKADFCYLICRTSRDGPPHRGISEIIVPMDAPGIEVRPIRDLTESNTFVRSGSTTCRVSADNLVVSKAEPFSQTMRQLEHERGESDRLVSNRALFYIARRRAEHHRRVVPSRTRAARDRLPRRQAVGDALGHGTSAARIRRGQRMHVAPSTNNASRIS